MVSVMLLKKRLRRVEQAGNLMAVVSEAAKIKSLVAVSRQVQTLPLVRSQQLLASCVRRFFGHPQLPIHIRVLIISPVS
jgi:hypothetical protein